MNSMGLGVEQVWTRDTEYPKVNARPVVGSQEWNHYVLDNSATTAEAIKNAEGVRIESEVKVHYLVSDKTGYTAAVDFLCGKMVVHTGENLPVATLTNDTYEKSINFKRTTPLAKSIGRDSHERFARAS